MIKQTAAQALRQVDRFFIWSYGSRYNPLVQSGALAVGLLTAVMISGTYLLFFYSVNEPYESLQSIEQQWYLGKWLRSFHRYASDAALVVVVYHSWKMLAQNRAWGPRTLAWLSGILMLCAFFISGWTGFVMVWDLHGQYVAQCRIS